MSPRQARNPFKEVGAAQEPTAELVLDITRQHTAAGAARAPEAPPPEFVQRQKQIAVAEPRPRGDVPRWIYARIEKGATPEEVLKHSIERVRRAPSESSFRLVQHLLNETGRRPEGGKYIRSLVTQELVDQLQAPGKEE